MGPTLAQTKSESANASRSTTRARPAAARLGPVIGRNASPGFQIGTGEPLSASMQARLGSSLNADFSGVRLHRDGAANRAAAAVGARAFTIGHRIVFGAGESPADANLLGHEAAHVLQQRDGAVAQTYTTGSGRALETEAGNAGTAVAQGGTYNVQGRAEAGRPQHAGLLEWAENKAWDLLEKHAPELVPIIKKGPEGVFDWLKEKITAGLEGMYNTLTAPIRAVAGVGRWLSTTFAPLLAWMQEAAAKIARNDCSPLREAAEKIEKVAEGIITPIVEKVQSVASTVGDVFKGLWEKFGAPVWDWIKKYAGQQWELIQRIASWIWDKTAPVRAVLNRAWTWIKNKLGIGDGPEGQDGILQWVQRKAEAAWDWIKAKIEPYKKQLMTVAAILGGIALLVSPAGPVLIIGGIVIGVVQGVRWIKANWGKGNLVVQARAYLEKTLIPSLLGAVNRMTAAVTKAAGMLNSKLGELSAGMAKMVGSLAESVLRFAVNAVQWIADQMTDLAQWGAQKLQALADWIQTALTRLAAFLQPVMAFLGKVASLIVDIYGLPLLLAGKLWNLIPSCIRDPFVDWIIPLILRQIDIFKELVKDTEAWQKTKADVMNILRLVFVKKDLKGAIKATFDLILRVFNVPIELLMQVVKKAAVAWDTVTAAPIKFLKNCVRTVGRGLKIYWDHLKDNLLYGIEGWLFGELAEKGIQKPNSWTNPWDLFQFALDVMGLSMGHVFDLMEKKFEKTTVDKLRKWYGRLSKAWDWIMEMRGKKPAEVTGAIIEAAKGFGKTVLEGVVVWIVEQVGIELAEMAAAAAASAGLSEVLDAIRRIYRAIKTAVRWMRQVLEMVNKALDSVLGIAAGIIEPSAIILEKAMKAATPAIIGFLGDQVGLGGIADEIRGLIDKLRAKVDDAILAMIDKLKSFFSAIAAGAKDVAAKLLEWWKESREVRVGTEKAKVYFEGDAAGATLTIASSPGKTYGEYLDGIESKMKTPAQKTAHAEALTLGAQIQSKIRSRKMSDADSTDVIKGLDRMAKLMKIMLGGKKIPPSIIEYGPLTAEQGGTEAEAKILSTDSGGSRGTEPADNPKIWMDVRNRKTDDDASAYVQGHLLNHNVHGPGKRFNMAPITYKANSDHKLGIEAKIKSLVLDQGEVVYYKIQAIYGKHPDSPAFLQLKNKSATDRTDLETGKLKLMEADRKLPTKFEFKAHVLENTGSSWTKDKNAAAISYPSVENVIPQKAPTREQLP